MKTQMLLLTGVFLLVSCTQENMPVNDSVGSFSNSNRITLNQALKTSARMMRQLDGGNTRSAFRTVGDVKVISQAKTRGDMNALDTMFYLVNYADNQGFAVLSADKRLAPVYAISNSGSLSESDTVDNPALSVFFERLRMAANSVNGDSIFGGGSVDLWPEEPDYGYGDGPYKYGPILSPQPKMLTTRMLSRMTNVSMDSINIVNFLALYTSSVNRWPLTHNGKTFNWDIINNPSNIDFLSLYMSGSDVIVDPDPIPDPGTNPSVNEVSRKRAPSEQELEDLKRQTWYEFTNYFYHIRPAIKSLAADLPPNPFVDEDGGGGGSSGGYTPPDYNNNSISIYKNIMNLLGFKFISNDFHLYTFEWPTIRDLIVTNALVIVSAESNHRDYNHIWVLDGWWSYGEHLDKGGKIPVIYGDEDIQLFHCVWPSCKKNNGWFKISYSSIDSTPTVLEPGEQNNTISYKKIKFLNNKAVPNK